MSTLALAHTDRAPATRQIAVLFLIKHMDIGGGEYVFRTIIDRLDRRSFRPILACLLGEGLFGRQLRGRGVAVYENLLHHKLDVGVVARLRRIIARERVDLLYIMDYCDTMLWGALAGRLSGIKTILATHSTYWWGPNWSPIFIGKSFLNWHHRVVAITHFQKKHLIAGEGVREGIIEVIPNGIDWHNYGAREDRDAGARRLPLKSQFVVGTVAVLRKEKNIGMLFAAVQRLVAAGLDVHVVVVGDGDQRSVLEAVVRGMNLSARVTFFGYCDRPADVLLDFDVFTLTSEVEVMPITILEAMGCRVPVVATAVGAVPEIVVDGVTGFVVSRNDVDALTDRLSRLAASADLRAEMGARGQDRVRSLFSIEVTMARTEALLREVVT